MVTGLVAALVLEVEVAGGVAALVDVVDGVLVRCRHVGWCFVLFGTHGTIVLPGQPPAPRAYAGYPGLGAPERDITH